MSETAPHFAAWMDDFTQAYYRRRPVNATFIGEHAYDHLLPDYSESGAGEALAEIESLLVRLQALPDERLSPSESIDRRLAEGFLLISRWEYQSGHFQRGNPSTYTGEAIFGLLSLFLSDFAPFKQRAVAAQARMHSTAQFLRQALDQLRQAPLPWSERAARECQGALEFLGEGLEMLIASQGVDYPGLRRAAGEARRAFADFQNFLENELSHRPSQQVACGEQAFDLHLRQGHFSEMGAQAIAAYAQDELQAAQAYLQEHAADFGAGSPQEALAQLSDLHPSSEHYYGRYPELWQAARQIAQEHELLTWPDFPIRYVPQPEWARKAAPYLYFLFYRAPAAFNRPAVHNYLVAPLDPGLPHAEQGAFLRANNDSVIKLNHVVHHGGIGHHVQNWHAYRAASRLGQIAAVDCAARIAMLCGGTMAEGWAVYATDLMAESGFLTPLERYSEYATRRRMCARAVVDCKLHTGRFNLAEAARYYEQQARMSPAGAYSEAVKTSMFPGAAVMYILGSDRIHRLRRTLSTRLGARFNLRDFHDRFLSYGSIPVELIAQEMEKEGGLA